MKGHHAHHHKHGGHAGHHKHGGHAGHHHKHGGHAHHAKGGRTDMVVSGNPDVLEEAHEKKHGGRAKHHKHHRAAGGKVQGTALGLMTGGAVRPRLDRPGRKMGGRVGADRSPLSSAHKSTSSESLPRESGGN